MFSHCLRKVMKFSVWLDVLCFYRSSLQIDNSNGVCWVEKKIKSSSTKYSGLQWTNSTQVFALRFINFNFSILGIDSETFDICPWSLVMLMQHYSDVIMSAMASQITSLPIVYSIVYSGADQRIHQSSASLAFVRGIHRSPVNSPHKRPVTRKKFSFDDVIMKTNIYNTKPRSGSV